MIGSFLVGAMAGGVAVWFWRDRIRQTMQGAAREARTRAAQGLENVRRSAEVALETARDRVSGGLQAGQEYLRAGEPEGSGSPGPYPH